MIINLTRIIRRIRQQRQIGIGVLIFVLVGSILGNALTFYLFDGGLQGDLNFGDALWYSVISITTIGYGDFSATSIGARLGTILFIVLIGLAAFTSAVGIGVDWILEQQYKERSGMGSPKVKDHLLLINFPNERRVRQILDEYYEDAIHKKDEIVIVTDQIESLPFTLPNVSFVRGSLLEEDTYIRAKVSNAKQAIVLSTSYDDPNSDSIAASIVSVLEHVNPNIVSVVEVLDENHSLLFQGAKNASLVFTFRVSNNLMVQEVQDPGVNQLTQAITSNILESNLASTRVEGNIGNPISYRDAAKTLLDHEINLVGIIRNGEVLVQFDSLNVSSEDQLVYVSSSRHDWTTLQALLQS